MKIDLVLTASDLHGRYIKLFPYVSKIWLKRFGLPCYLLLINNEIPPELSAFKNHIILIPPLTGINTIFIAQTIRILYPALFDNKNVLTTDIDIFPVNKKYFLDSIEKYSDDQFITWTDRYVKQKMYAICYNCANSKVWKKIFKIYSLYDAIKTIKAWYNPKFTGMKNCEGWFTDQQKLFEYAHDYKNLVVLNDKDLNFNRLDKNQKVTNKIVENISDIIKDIQNDKYTDIHVFRNYHEHLSLLHQIVTELIR